MSHIPAQQIGFPLVRQSFDMLSLVLIQLVDDLMELLRMNAERLQTRCTGPILIFLQFHATVIHLLGGF